MRIGLVGFFDVGRSYGLGDEVFPEQHRDPEPDIGLVGLNFPLGQGLLVDLTAEAPEIVRLWRDEAAAQATRPEMETGWSPELGLTREKFDRVLEGFATRHPVTRCELRVHAIGTVYAELQLDRGVPLEYVAGVLACFEFAAYRPAVANALLAAAERRVEAALGPALTGLVELSERALPGEKADAKGYAERMLFSSGFTNVIACVDEGDDELLPALVETHELESARAVEFEYHGTLRYTWATSVLVPNQLSGWDAPGGEGESPQAQIMRMEACIRVAHVFLGTCEAFVRLFESEMHVQVARYVGMKVSGRGPEELNRLRTLALAVVNLTRFERVTPSEEDQEYFRLFEENADIRGKHEMIQHATELLYNVQIAETQDKDTRRQWILSIIVGLLTSLTLISVTADAYDFVRSDESLIERRLYRLLVVGIEFTLILAILAALIMLAVRSQQRRRPRS